MGANGSSKARIALAILGIGGFGGTSHALAQSEPGSVLGEAKIAWSSGGFTGVLADRDTFGTAVAGLGDLDGDGVPDAAVGAPGDDTGGTDCGALWILFLRSDGTVRAEQKLDATAPQLAGLAYRGRFGASVALLGDLDGDGRPEVAVGAEQAPGGGLVRGEVWILSLESDGTVAAATRIADGAGGFGGPLLDGDRFGRAVAGIDDLDGDGTPDLLVGADQDDDGGWNRGAAWVLFLNPDGTVARATKISNTSGNFAGVLADNDRFGAGVALVGDLDGDGVAELAVAADQHDDGASGAGSIWILFPHRDGSVRAHARIGAASGLALDGFDRFGRGLAGVGDVDGDGLPDLAAGAIGDDDGTINTGGTWVLFLDATGGLAAHAKISMTSGGFLGALVPNDRFGGALAALGDVDGDDKLDLVVGADGDDEGGFERGATWVLFLEGVERPSDPGEPGEPGATMTLRNGSGINPMALSATEAPRVGLTWSVTVDAGNRKNGVVQHDVYLAPSEGRMLGRLGELLVDRSSRCLFREVVHHRGGLVTIEHEIPDDPTLAGVAFASQAMITGKRPTLTNALDGTIAP